MMDRQQIVDVYTAENGVEAHFLRGLLAGQEIDAHVVEDTLQSSLPMVAAPHLWVHQADADRAREILKEWEQGRCIPRNDDRPPPVWICPTCGAEVDDELDLCWHCQTPRVPY